LNTNSSAIDILNEFKILKNSQIDEKEFFKLYLEACSFLCKSECSILLFKSKDDIEHKLSYNKPSDNFIQNAKNLALKALENNFAYERYDENNANLDSPYIFVFKNYKQDSLIALLLDKSSQSQFNEMLVRTQLINDTPYLYFLKNQETKNQIDTLENVNTSLSSTKNPLELFNIIIHKDNFKLALLTLVNELSFRFHCSQVSIGWIETKKIKTKAVSSIESFEKNSDTISLLEELFEEVALQNETLVYPNEDISLALYESKEYFIHKNITQLVSIPIHHKDEICGVLVCEMIDDELSSHDIDLLKLIVNQISPWIINLQQNDEFIHKKIARKFVRFIENTFSVKYTGLKFVVASLLILLIASFIIKVDYKIDGISTIETDNVTYISAPYEGMIDDVKFSEGDDVLKDQLLIELNTNELKLKANESKSNIIKYTQEAEKARATYALADMKIALSKRNETKIALERVNYYISQSKIKAPYDGIIVEGDKTKLLGAPINKGDVILKIAKLGSMYLKIKVNERDIDNIMSTGKFIFLSRPGKVYTITVDKIIPIAEVDKDEGNIFVVKAFINDEQQSWWRPGMSGIAKLDAGERTLFWVATHRLVDFFRIYIWW